MKPLLLSLVLLAAGAVFAADDDKPADTDAGSVDAQICTKGGCFNNNDANRNLTTPTKKTGRDIDSILQDSGGGKPPPLDESKTSS